MKVPSDTRSLLEELEELYPDKYEIEYSLSPRVLEEGWGC